MVASVKLYDRWRSDESCLLNSTQRILESLSERIASKSLLLELDVQGEAAGRFCSTELSKTVEQLLDLAIGRSPKDGELEVVVVYSRRGIEIEVSDSGAPIDSQRAVSAFRTKALDRIPGSSRWFDGGRLPSNMVLYCSSCPQGGVAWTLVVAESALSVKVA